MAAFSISRKIPEVVLIQASELETAGDFIFQQFFHFHVAVDFIIWHGDKVIHQRMVDLIQELFECQKRRFLHAVKAHFFLCHNELEADKKAVQIFIGIEDMVDIKINNKPIKCNFIVIDRNVPHAFSANNKIYYSSLIDPTSVYAQKLMDLIGDNKYFVCNPVNNLKLLQQGENLLYQYTVNHEYWLIF